MKNCYNLKISLLIIGVLFLSTNTYSQIAPIDTLKVKTDDNSLLPIFGNKVRAKGYKLPLSAGVNLNYFWQKSDIVVSDVAVGFNNSDLINVDNLLRFNNTNSRSSLMNFRADIWLFPFLNVYGIFSQGTSSTNINADIVIPRLVGGGERIFNLSVSPEFDVTTTGIGLNPVMGGKHWWVSFNTTFTWSDISSLDDPVFSVVFNPRVGTNFKFKNPNQMLSVWMGGFRLKIDTGTQGSLPISQLGDFSNLGPRIDSANASVDVASQELQTWWDGLSVIQKNNPVNKVRYQAGVAAFNTASEFLNIIREGADATQGGNLGYSVNKRQKQAWNFMLGFQFQINKRLNFRGEYGFLGSRQHAIAGLEYRMKL